MTEPDEEIPHLGPQKTTKPGPGIILSFSTTITTTRAFTMRYFLSCYLLPLLLLLWLFLLLATKAAGPPTLLGLKLSPSKLLKQLVTPEFVLLRACYIGITWAPSRPLD